MTLTQTTPFHDAITKEIIVSQSIYNVLNTTVRQNNPAHIENSLNSLLSDNSLSYENRVDISKKLDDIYRNWSTLSNLQSNEVLMQMQALHHYINILKHFKNDANSKRTYNYDDLDRILKKLKNFKKKQPFSISMEIAILSAETKVYDLIRNKHY